MEAFLEAIETYGTQLSALAAACAFMFGAYKFQVERKAVHFWKEFEAYHKLVKELVDSTKQNGAMYVDRQTAAMYELRFYRRYYSHSLRMLKGLREKWVNVADQFPRLIDELDLTIQYINTKT